METRAIIILSKWRTIFLHKIPVYVTALVDAHFKQVGNCMHSLSFGAVHSANGASDVSVVWVGLSLSGRHAWLGDDIIEEDCPFLKNCGCKDNKDKCPQSYETSSKTYLYSYFKWSPTQWPRNLRSGPWGFVHKIRDFESRLGHRCLSWISMSCCAV
jgi:hypothetical protein